MTGPPSLALAVYLWDQEFAWRARTDGSVMRGPPSLALAVYAAGRNFAGERERTGR